MFVFNVTYHRVNPMLKTLCIFFQVLQTFSFAEPRTVFTKRHTHVSLQQQKLEKEKQSKNKTDMQHLFVVYNVSTVLCQNTV